MGGNGDRPVVLNVDDSDQRLRLRTRILEDSGFSVLEARTGSEALRITAAQQPSIVLLDVDLPDISGLEVCRSLKATAATESIPVLQVSAQSTDEAQWVEGLRTGAESYLREPFSGDVLVEVINRLLKRAEADAKSRDSERAAQQALRVSEQRYRALFEHAVHGICQTTKEGRFVAVNRALARMLGYESSRELMAAGNLIQFYVDPADRERIVREIDRRSAVGGVEVLWRKRYGDPFPVRLSSRRTDTGYEVFVEDVTERHHLEEQLRQSQKLEALGQLAGGVAHDFNNALTVILGYAEMLTQSNRVAARVKRDLNELRGAAEHAATLTQQLLAFSRQQPLRLDVTDVNAAVTTAVGMLKRLISETIIVETRLTSEPLLVKADAGQLQEALVNLAVNARDAMPEGGFLTFQTAPVALVSTLQVCDPPLPPGRYVRLSVSDTGVGMDDATMRRIFEPFFTTKANGRGTGLGMSMVYGIVKQFGGGIFVESVKGQGTRVHLYLPETSEPVLLQIVQKPLDLTSGTATVLVVEDEAPVRGLVVEALKRQGYRVLEASGSIEALEVSDDVIASVDLLLTDVVMTAVSGRVLAQRLRAVHPHLRVLYMSGYAGLKVGEADAPEFDGPFLRKPFTSSELLATVQHALAVEI